MTKITARNIAENWITENHNRLKDNLSFFYLGLILFVAPIFQGSGLLINLLDIDGLNNRFNTQSMRQILSLPRFSTAFYYHYSGL